MILLKNIASRFNNSVLYKGGIGQLGRERKKTIYLFLAGRRGKQIIRRLSNHNIPGKSHGGRSLLVNLKGIDNAGGFCPTSYVELCKKKKNSLKLAPDPYLIAHALRVRDDQWSPRHTNFLFPWENRLQR